MNEDATRRIDHGWTVELVGSNTDSASPPAGPIQAPVPGVVHQALLGAGLRVDSNVGDAEVEQRWVGWSDWTWRRRMVAGDLPSGVSDDDVVDIEFESIDTIGSILVDGVEAAKVGNQFHPHRVRIPMERFSAGLLIEVALRSPLRSLEEAVAEHGDRPVNADGEWGIYSYLRKAACSFGWDWGPKAPSLGLPGPVRLHRWRDATIRSLRPLVSTCRADSARIDVHAEIDRDARTAGDGDLELSATVEGPAGGSWSNRVSIDATTVSLGIDVSNPMLWWPRGHGEQPLYRVVVELRRGGRTIECTERRIGLRDVRLDRTEDDAGSAFRVRVNDRPILCLGANWIPDGLYPGTAPPDRIRERIGQAVGANFNMLRVWGGGTYESREFYEACDELGVLVWQDFMFACATYPEHPAFLDSVEREARHQVARLASHPSVVLWCGGNENLLAYETWGWKERMPPDQSWGRRIFTETLPRVVSELDPTRPFLPDSPWSDSLDRNPNDPDRGDRHTWDLKLEEVRDLVPRFLSEFGHQSPPMRETIEAAIGSAALSTERPEALGAFASRQRGWGGDEAQYDRWLAEWFPPAESLERRLWFMHLLQARAMTFTYEWLRLHRDRCGGVLVWQLNDAWSGHSWSIIDVAGRCKPAWWAARRACRPVMLAFNVIDEAIAIGVDNDRADAFAAPIEIRRKRFDGSDVAAFEMEFEVSPRSSSSRHLPPEVTSKVDPSRELLVARAGTERAFWFFGKDAWLDLPSPRVRIAVVETAGAAPSIKVEARTLVRDLFLEIRGVDARVRPLDNLVTLLPGEEWRTSVAGLTDSDAATRGSDWWASRLFVHASGPGPVDVSLSFEG